MTLVIDVASGATPARLDGRTVVVLVEPLYGVPAVALALDAGWGSVELAADADARAPIPLVSFEQPPPADQRGGRCRVRCDDLRAAAAITAKFDAAAVLLGAPMLARPLASRLAAASDALERIVFVPAPSRVDVPDPAAGIDALALDAWWSSGMLIRVLLEELDERPSLLADGAGLAVTLAQGAEPAVTQLGAGLRWRRHLARGGHADDLRVASTIDAIGVVPALVDRDADPIAVDWDGAVA